MDLGPKHIKHINKVKDLMVSSSKLRPIPFNPPKSRASKIILFQHYQTDAPI